MKQVTHLMDYPPRGTACGLYYPKKLGSEGFGTYSNERVTCKKCLQYIKRKEKEMEEGYKEMADMNLKLAKEFERINNE